MLFESKKRLTAILLRVVCLLSAMMLMSTEAKAQTSHELYHYDEFNSDLQGHATQILTDRDGLLWIATWNGLYRFDGYEFMRFTPTPGDGCHMGSVRLRDIWLDDDGHIICMTDDGIFRFRIDTYRFSDITAEEDRRQAAEARFHQTSRGSAAGGSVDYTDARRLHWNLQGGCLRCSSLRQPPAKPIAIRQPAQVRCLWADTEGRIWIATKDDAALALYDTSGRCLCYIGPDGRLGTAYRSFGKPVYSIGATGDGSIWLGCKPGGLVRLSRTDGGFRPEPVEALANSGIYDLATDRFGRLWAATLGDGLACIPDPGAQRPDVILNPGDYPDSAAQRIRRLHITRDGQTIIAATTEGLVTATLSGQTDAMHFRRHTKEPDRPTSLSDNATTDLAETTDGQLFVSTETAGICEVAASQLGADTLNFRHYNVDNGLMPNDITQAMTLAPDGRLVVTGSSQVVFLDVNRPAYTNLDRHFFIHPYRFSEARPMFTAGRWFFGLTDGAIALPQDSTRLTPFVPPLLLTAIDIHQEGTDSRRMMAVATMDTLRLTPAERSLTIHFAALDYTDPTAVSYQFRIGSQPTGEWVNLGHDHSITLPKLESGTHLLCLRSTNANGQWTDNERRLTIIAQPAFHETLLARILFMLATLAAVVLAISYVFHTRSIERQQKETLQKYLELLRRTEEAHQPTEALQSAAPTVNIPDIESDETPGRDDAFMQRVIHFVEQNIANDEADVALMAESCAVSRSVLQRRMKQLTGITPTDFLREARLQHACQMLRAADLPVADVAYQCGFSDPKYFSRCFKQHTGLSPSDYKRTNGFEN